MAEPHSVIGSLMHEHKLILRVVDDMRLEAARGLESAEVDAVYVDRVVDFFLNYADRAHHGKEEQLLFARLEGKSMPDELAEQMRCLVEDHRWAREMTDRIADSARRYENGESEAHRDVAEALDALGEFYPQHIDREDHHFFKPAIALLTPEERTAMADEFVEFDRHAYHERYRALADELQARRAVIV